MNAANGRCQRRCCQRFRTVPGGRPKYDIHPALAIEVVAYVDPVAQCPHHGRHLLPRPAGFGYPSLIRNKAYFRLGEVDAGNRSCLGARQRLCNGAHTKPGRCQHGIHVTTLNIQFDARVAGQAIENTERISERHCVRKAGQNLEIQCIDERVYISCVFHHRADETERAEHAVEVRLDLHLRVVLQVWFHSFRDDFSEFFSRRRRTLAGRRNDNREHPSLVSLRQIICRRY